MHLKLLDGTTSHVEPNVARVLVAAKLATEIVPFKPSPNPDAVFTITPGRYIGTVQNPPYIHVHCNGCGKTVFIEGRKTVEETFVFHHCEIHEPVPSAVRREYIRQYNAHLNPVKRRWKDKD